MSHFICSKDWLVTSLGYWLTSLLWCMSLVAKSRRPKTWICLKIYSYRGDDHFRMIHPTSGWAALPVFSLYARHVESRKCRFLMRQEKWCTQHRILRSPTKHMCYAQNLGVATCETLCWIGIATRTSKIVANHYIIDQKPYCVTDLVRRNFSEHHAVRGWLATFTSKPASTSCRNWSTMRAMPRFGSSAQGSADIQKSWTRNWCWHVTGEYWWWMLKWNQKWTPEIDGWSMLMVEMMVEMWFKTQAVSWRRNWLQICRATRFSSWWPTFPKVWTALDFADEEQKVHRRPLRSLLSKCKGRNPQICHAMHFGCNPTSRRQKLRDCAMMER